MNHFVGDMIGKMLLQFRMTLEKRQMALVGDAVKIIDLGDKAIPVLPEDFDRFHRQRAVRQVAVKTPLDKPSVGDISQKFL